MVFKATEPEVRNSLGRFVELLPYSITAFAYSEYKKVKREKVGLAFIAGLLMICVGLAGIWPGCPGWSYQGVELFLFSVGVCLVFSELGEALECGVRVKCIVGFLAGLTAGVYYLHMLVGRLVERIFHWEGSLMTGTLVAAVSAMGVFLLKRSKVSAWLVR